MCNIHHLFRCLFRRPSRSNRDHKMSRNTRSQARSQAPLDGSDLDEERRVDEILTNLRTLASLNPSTQTENNARVDTARTIIQFLNTSTFMIWPGRYDDQIFLITELQNIAYHEADNGGVQHVAQWCIMQFLDLLARYPDSILALTGKQHSGK